MGSLVDTVGDNQNAHVIDSYKHTMMMNTHKTVIIVMTKNMLTGTFNFNSVPLPIRDVRKSGLLVTSASRQSFLLTGLTAFKGLR